MLKALIIGADAVCPDYIFDHPEQYPNLAKIVSEGASAAYSAYVQKGYRDSYLSEMNWSSIYTGLAPWEHKIAAIGKEGHRQTPYMKDFQGLAPFWEALNAGGLTVGLWAALCCIDPVEIDGYVISSHYEMVDTPSAVRTARRTLQTCERDKGLLNLISEKVPPRLYPRTLEQQGYCFERLLQNPELAWKAAQEYHFQDALENFEEELEFFFQAMCEVQNRRPVDVLYFYTPTTDLIAHCSMYCDNSEILVAAYQLLDRYIGKWIEAFHPENVIVLSDHGMCNFKDLIQCKDEAVRREAFAARDEVLWLPNGYIAFEARNGALLFTAHALKGMFIASGREICHTTLEEMRTLDIYPTILELLNVPVPDGRAGFVQDIFNRPVRNETRLLRNRDISYQSAAVLQCWSPSLTDIVLNEIYVHNRFTRLTVIGEEKYREIFLHNPRVNGFLTYDEFRPAEFDAVYCGVFNETSGLTRHIQVC